MIQLELQFLSRPVLLLSQEEPQQRLTLQRCHVLKGKRATRPKCRQAAPSILRITDINVSVPHWRRTCRALYSWWQTKASSTASYCLSTSAGSRSWRSFLCWQKPGKKKKSSGRWISMAYFLETPRTQTFPLLASFSAAGIFFCFLVKEKAPDLMGETDVEAQRLPKRNKTSKKWAYVFIRLFSRRLKIASQTDQNWSWKQWDERLFTVLLQLGKAVVTHARRLVLQVLQVVLIGRASLTHHLSTTPSRQEESGQMLDGTPELMSLRESETLPQARQWCLLQVMVNSQVQIMHMVALRSGIQMGAFEPKGALSSTTASVCFGRLKSARTLSGYIGNTGVLVLPPPDFYWIWRLSFSWCSRLWPWRWPPTTRPSL